jgi:hypothetical protein
MKSFQVIVNVANYQVDEEFEIELRATFWNGSKENEDWIARTISAPINKLFISIKFPKKKTFTRIKEVMYKFGDESENPIPEGQSNTLYTPSHNNLYLELHQPIWNNTYEIQWNW